jgi:pyruvate,water dikinase
MGVTLIVSFPVPPQAPLAEVGGKGHTLIKMVAAGLPGPHGAVLTTHFFAPWFDQILASDPLSRLTESPPDKWASACDELKSLCPAL